MKIGLIWLLVLFCPTSVFAQTSATAARRNRTTSAGLRATEIQELKDAITAQQQRFTQQEQEIAAQQRQLATQQQQLTTQQTEIQELKQGLQERDTELAKVKADTSVVSEQQQTVADLHRDVADLKQNITSTALSLQEAQKGLEAPQSIHFKGIAITPGGFLAGETVWRAHALGADINTPFNSIPFAGASASHISEFFGSGRQSRISMLAEGHISSAKLTGYVEADFLSAGITSNNNQSNSYSLRQRQVWAQAALNNGWSFTGGQMWSLLTETRKGVDNRTEALPMTIDPQYNVGFTWARQYGFRVAKNFGDRMWWAASVENAQATLGGHLAPGQNNFLIGSQGASSGLYNPTANYSFNPSPDVITKFVFEPGIGHYEVFGILRDFRDRIFPCGGNITATNGVLPPAVPCANGTVPNSAGAYNNSRLGWGGGINARATLAHHVDIGIHAIAGDGIGRYGSAGLPDTVVRPDGVLVPIRNYQALSTLEWHSGRLDLYANVGAEYAARTAYVSGSSGSGYGSPLFNNSGCYTEAPPSSTIINVDTPVSSTSSNPVGSGTVPNPGSTGTPLSPGFNPANPPNCTGDTRSIFEGTLGFWYRFYKGPKGTLQWGPQYSYIDRNTWAGKGAVAGTLSNPSAGEGMVFTSFRYYLP